MMPANSQLEQDGYFDPHFAEHTTLPPLAGKKAINGIEARRMQLDGGATGLRRMFGYKPRRALS
jgi:hypothetical protein